MIDPETELEASEVASGGIDKWAYLFEDIPLPPGVPAYRELYYKSECRPLRLLKPHHRRFHNVHHADFREWLDLRDRARKDLYWLGKECIATEQSGSGFVEHVHREMCDQFVKKNFDGVYHRNYTLQEVRDHIGTLPRQKEMLLLAPRGSYKSTVNKLDCCQWMLNAPDIRIFIITGSGGLSEKFLKEVKGYFYQPDRQPVTFFQSLFPEYILHGLDGVSAANMYCPARVCRQEGNPTLWVNSIDGRLAGWHCFGAGTLITCRRGLVPIEDVGASDLVLTRKGWKRVLRAGVTGVEPVIDFLGMKVTPGHRFFTEEEGFSSIVSVLCHETRNLLIHKESYSEALSSGATRAQKHIRTELTSGATGEEERNIFTARFGSPCTASSHRESMSTTKTMTPATTRSTAATTRFAKESNTGVITEEDKETISRSTNTSPASTAERTSCVEIENDSVARLAVSCTSVPSLLPAITVYDLQVEDCPEFFANGILVHNCDVMKGDDVVNEVNSDTEDTRAKLKGRYDNAAQFLPDQWAFRDQVGTRYYDDDWYGGRIADALQYPDTNGMQYLCRSAWYVKPEYAEIPIKQLTADMVDLYFPEKMDFRSLIAEARANEKLFRCQKLNEPAGSDTVIKFERAMIEKATITLARVPRPVNGSDRKIVCTWDTAHTAKTSSDYSAGAAQYCHEATRTLYVLEVRHDKWRDSDVARQVVDLHFKWSALFSSLEKFGGWELLRDEIQRYAVAKYARNIALQWRDVDVSAGAKRNRVRALEALLKEDRLKFVEGLWMDDLTQQFIRFTGFAKKRKDDIPDAISPGAKLIPAPLGPQSPDGKIETEAERIAREAKECRERFAKQHASQEYGTYFQPPPPAPLAPMPAPTNAAPVDGGPGWIFGNTGIHL